MKNNHDKKLIEDIKWNIKFYEDAIERYKDEIETRKLALKQLEIKK